VEPDWSTNAKTLDDARDHAAIVTMLDLHPQVGDGIERDRSSQQLQMARPDSLRHRVAGDSIPERTTALTTNFRDHLAGLLRQMEWADAYIWSIVLASPAAASDPRLLTTFHHIHSTQHVFRQAWTNEPLELRDRADFPTAIALAEWARESHQKIEAFFTGAPTATLDEDFREPWTGQFEARFPSPAAPHTLGESVVQVVLHTAHHRGQACTRLRELRCQPPTVDFIVWLWAGKPAPDWACLGDRPGAAEPQQT
jgi:uncharacterized damage-inducible protein DinB